MLEIPETICGLWRATFWARGVRRVEGFMLLLEVKIINLYIKKPFFIYIYRTTKRKQDLVGCLDLLFIFFAQGCLEGTHLFWIYRYSVILRTSSLANERFIEDVGTYILLFISPGVNISELIHALLPLAVLQVLPLSLNHLQKKDTTSSPPKNSFVQQLLATKKNIRQAPNKRNQWLIVPQ